MSYLLAKANESYCSSIIRNSYQNSEYILFYFILYAIILKVLNFN